MEDAGGSRGSEVPQPAAEPGGTPVVSAVAGSAPPDAERLIAGLRGVIRALREEIRALREQLTQLQARNRELEARVHQNARNSSRPPSSDPPSVPPRPSRQRSGRQRGGQPGHPGHRCVPIPREQVDRFVDCWPTECVHCHDPLPGPGARQETGPPLGYQVQDVRVVREVRQYDRHRVHCPHCGRSTLAPLPAGVARSP